MRTFLILLIICSSFYFIGNKKLKTISGMGRDTPLIQNENFEVLQSLRRPETYYTQGLFFDDDGKTLIESGGLYGESSIVKMEYPSLKVLKKTNLDKQYFAEGIAKCHDNVYQLTWQERKILKYSYPDLDLLGTLDLDSQIAEGWGLSNTNSPDELIASDGSNKIYFLDCLNNLVVKRSIVIRNGDKLVDRINDMAFGNGFIWANRYFDNHILKIDPNNGQVVKMYDLSALVDFEMSHLTLSSLRFSSGDVLNGIAFNKASGKFLITGKRWGYYYEVNFK